MFYDIRMKYANKEDMARIKTLEKDIKNRTEAITKTVEKDFADYVRSFGLTGPMAHAEATIFFLKSRTIGSDIDLAIVTNFLSPKRQRELEKRIKHGFSGIGAEAGPLFFAPSITNKPDLLFCEYANSGKVLFGERISCKGKIPVWEAAKILTSRCGGFFDSIRFDGGPKKTEKFSYAWAKSALAAAEALLILEGRYEFSVRERLRKLETSKYTKEVPELFRFCQQAYLCRYSGKLPKRKNIIQETAEMLSDVFEKTAGALAKKSGRGVAELTAPFPSALSTRGFYFINSLKKGKMTVPLSEPLVKEFEEMRKMLAMLKDGKTPPEKQRLHAVHLWKHAERFWLPY